MGLLPVRSGRVTFEGHDITRLKPHQRAQLGIALVPQGREIFPRLTRVAGFEWGSGFYINPVPPEQAAAFLREVELDG